MKGGAYYNENDPQSAAWLRGLIKAGLIAPGTVDERSICEVKFHEVEKYRQCHFFAGVGGWSQALRLAGWLDDRPVWTGSCPCQPFSDSGLRRGVDDERHLWPVWFGLIRQRRPAVVLGEQVASGHALRWWDGVSTDLEGEGYAAGAADLCAAGIGAPQLRQRLWWMAYADLCGCAERGGCLEKTESQGGDRFTGLRGPAGGMAGAEGIGLPGRDVVAGHHAPAEPERRGAVGRLGDVHDAGSQGRLEQRDGAGERSAGPAGVGVWSRYGTVYCADDRHRRVERGTFPMAHGIPSRVGPLLTELRKLGKGAVAGARANRNCRIRGYGNAIVPQVAAEFIRACMGG